MTTRSGYLGGLIRKVNFITNAREQEEFFAAINRHRERAILEGRIGDETSLMSVHHRKKFHRDQKT